MESCLNRLVVSLTLLCMLPETCSWSALLPASQVVLHEGQILEKPEDEAEASICTMCLHCCVTTMRRLQRFLAACPAATLTGAALHCRVRACARLHGRICSADRPGQWTQLGRRGCGHGASGASSCSVNMVAEGLSLRKAPPYATVCFAGSRPLLLC